MRKTKGYWDNKENVFTEARKYKRKYEFQKSCRGAYKSALKHGWLKEMDWFEGKKWDYEHCYQEAKQHKTKNEFRKCCGTAYNASLKHGWLDDYTWFVDGKIKMLTDKNDSVYKYYWEETNAIYIGRTLISQQKDRINNHRTSEKDTVFKYAKENGLEVPQMEIIEENITPIEGLEREDYWVNYYKEKGYNVLNKAKTGVGSGSLGAINSGKWNKKTVFEEGKKYKTKKEFSKGCASAYNAARRNGWLSEMGFEEMRKPNGYWTKEKCYEIAKLYKTRYELKKSSPKAYDAARRNGWLKEMDFEEVKKPNGYWDVFENVQREAKKCKNRRGFQKSCSRAYLKALKNKWIDILFPIKKVA